MKIYSPQEVIPLIQAKIKKEGTQSAFAKRIGVSASFLHDVLNGRRAPNEKIIQELGLTKIRGFAKR